MSHLHHTTRLAGRTALRAAVTLSLLFLLLVGIGPLTGRYRVVTVLTGSMDPTAPAGSLLLSTPQSPDQLEVGQIISFQAPIDGHPVVTHRVTEILNPGDHPTIRTKGDANRAADPWDARIEEGPIWRTRLIVPVAGGAIRALRSPWVHNLTVFVAPLALLLLTLLSIWTPSRAPESLEA